MILLFWAGKSHDQPTHWKQTYLWQGSSYLQAYKVVLRSCFFFFFTSSPQIQEVLVTKTNNGYSCLILEILTCLFAIKRMKEKKLYSKQKPWQSGWHLMSKGNWLLLISLVNIFLGIFIKAPTLIWVWFETWY